MISAPGMDPAGLIGVASTDPFTGPARGTKDPRTVAAGVAGLFYTTMLSEMEKTVPTNGYFGGRGEETFRSLWVTEMSSRMASRPDDPLTTAILKSIEQHAAAAAAYGGAAK